MTDEKNIEQAAGWIKQMNVEDELQETKRKIQQRKPFYLLPFAIAAVIFLIVAGVYLNKNRGNKNNTSIVATAKQDIMPGANVATLTLDNGEKISFR